MLVSGPAVVGPEADATFLQANASGTSVVFETAARLSADDTNSDPDVYRWTEGVGIDCLTCVVPDANVQSIAGEFTPGIGVSEDLSHVYFISEAALAAGATEGEGNIYVLRGGTISFVAPASSVEWLSNNPADGAEITPDGSVLVFSSSSGGMDALSGSSNGGTRQYYLYDDRTGKVSCVSCPGTGTPISVFLGMVASGNAGPTGFVPVLSKDGKRFFFRTESALVPQDVNSGPDIYEWHDGSVGLVTDGVSEGGTRNQPTVALRGISEKGEDVFFTSFAGLTPGASDRSMELYDARVDGGEPLVSVAGGCDGEACQGAGGVVPVFGAPASVGFAGAGNVVAGSAGGKGSVAARVGVRRQRLHRALRACARRRGRSRHLCEAGARRRFGAVSSVRGGK
jgi:hypothetical protein